MTKRRSSRGWLCREINCRDMARDPFPGVAEAVLLDAFAGEPMTRVSAIVQAALEEEAKALDKGDPLHMATYLTRWAQRNKAGVYRPVERRTKLQLEIYGDAPANPLAPAYLLEGSRDGQEHGDD